MSSYWAPNGLPRSSGYEETLAPSGSWQSDDGECESCAVPSEPAAAGIKRRSPAIGTNANRWTAASGDARCRLESGLEGLQFLPQISDVKESHDLAFEAFRRFGSIGLRVEVVVDGVNAIIRCHFFEDVVVVRR